MWNIFKKKIKKTKKEFVFEYAWHNLNFNTIIFAKSRQSAIEIFTDTATYTHIISVKEV
jgi:hypothetical protein